MSRRLEQPVEVVGSLPSPGDGRSGPAAFIVWRNRRLKVLECLEEWYETGRWWDGEGEKRFVRVLTEAGIYELGFDVATGRWQLYRILD